MKYAATVLAVLALLAPAALAEVHTGTAPRKTIPSFEQSAHDGRIEGDTVEECWTIPALPFNDAGNTCGFAHDYEVMCPYGSDSPDVVYSYSPPYDLCVSISLCNSFYDTKVFVFEDDGWIGGDAYACNDDNFYCVNPPVEYTSWLERVDLFAGHTYYIVVDGYSGQCGDYVLEMQEIYCGPECEIVCVGTPEGEPTCYEGYEDQYNGGCQNDTWSMIPATPEPITICGETGVFNYGGVTYRDTDWYLIYPCGGVPITATIEAELNVLLMYVDMRNGCDDYAIWSYLNASECEVASLTEYLPAGQFAVFVAPQEWSLDYECGTDYSLTLEGYTEHCDPTPVEAATWGRVKALYR